MEDITFYFDNKLEDIKNYLKLYIQCELKRQREFIKNDFKHEIDMLRKEVLYLRDKNSQKTDEFFQMELQFQEEEINKKNYKIIEKKKEEKIIKLNTFLKKDKNNEIRNNILIISEKKILIIVDFLLDDLGGDTVMLMNFINMFIKNKNEITLLSKKKPSDLFIENLSDKSIEIIDYNNIYNVDFEKYYFYFVRVSFPINYIIDEEYYYKLVIYGMDKYIENIKCLNNAFSCVIVQSEQLKTFFIESGINENKIIIKEPIVKKYDFNIKKDKTLKLIYCGTLRDEENILEIIDYFKKLRLKNKNVLLTIVYGKIVGNSSFKSKIENIISKKQDGIIFKHNLTHKDACYEIANSDIGICWRKSGWGDNGEISTKIKEYELYNLQIINSIDIVKHNFIIVDNKLVINNCYYITINDSYFLENFFNNNLKELDINVKFKNNFNTLNLNKESEIKYNFFLTSVKTNKRKKIKFYKNVIYEIQCKKENIRVDLFNNKDDTINIFRNCLDNSSKMENIYFMVRESDNYEIFLKSKLTTSYNIYNYISINYLCRDNVYMLNLEHQHEKFKINKIILNKYGIDVKRFNAVNGYDKKYDELWNNYNMKPLTSDEKKINRKYLKRGSIGYLLSMKKIFENVKCDYVCIFDDDVLIRKDFTLKRMSELLITFSDFNILRFGSSQWSFDNIVLNKNYYNSNLNSNGSFSGIYKKNTYKDIIKKINLFTEPFDFIPIKQFNNDNSYVIYPNIMIANLDDISTITHKNRRNEYKKFHWDITLFNKPEFINKKNVLFENKFDKKIHFYIGITHFKRFRYLQDCLESLVKTIKHDYNFTIFLNVGLDINECINKNIENLLIRLFYEYKNVNVIVNYTYLHYIYYASNNILNYALTIDYDFGFILNDDITFSNNWYIEYYNLSKKHTIGHLCWQRNSKLTTFLNDLKHNGSVLNANGVLLTFTNSLINNVGIFNEIDFNVRGQSHIEWSIRCCNGGYNNKDMFYDIANSNELIKLNTNEYSSAISNSKYFDKVLHFVDTVELIRRNKLINKLLINNYE